MNMNAIERIEKMGDIIHSYGAERFRVHDKRVRRYNQVSLDGKEK